MVAGQFIVPYKLFSKMRGYGAKLFYAPPHTQSIPTINPSVKDRLKHSSPARNTRVAGRGHIKHVVLILNKNTQTIEFTKKFGLQF